MKSRFVALVLFPLLITLSVAAQNNVSVQDMPPVAIKSVPQSGDVTVDPGLKEISVTFSKDMMTKEMWSWVQINPASFPKVTGQAHFLGDKRTCVLPVQLEPGKSYAIWINSEQHNNFRDAGGRPAVPYLLVFQTKR